MNKIKVLYADANKEYTELVKDRLLQESYIELIGVVGDGREALKLIEEQRPNVIILDTVLTMIDGIGVLEELNMKYGNMPNIIVVSTIIRDDLISKVTNVLGAKYFIPKPFDIDTLLRRIREVSGNDDLNKNEFVVKEDYYTHSDSTNQRGRNRGEVLQSFISNKEDSLRDKVTDILDGLGAPVHLKGYAYLREAIVLVADDKAHIEGATKNLYPKVAKQYEATTARVERAIRHTITVIFQRGKKENLDKIFTIPSNKDKPTNLEFIAVVANRVKENSDKNE